MFISDQACLKYPHSVIDLLSPCQQCLVSNNFGEIKSNVFSKDKNHGFGMCLLVGSWDFPLLLLVRVEALQMNS